MAQWYTVEPISNTLCFLRTEVVQEGSMHSELEYKYPTHLAKVTPEIRTPLQ